MKYFLFTDISAFLLMSSASSLRVSAALALMALFVLILMWIEVDLWLWGQFKWILQLFVDVFEIV